MTEVKDLNPNEIPMVLFNREITEFIQLSINIKVEAEFWRSIGIEYHELKNSTTEKILAKCNLAGIRNDEFVSRMKIMAEQGARFSELSEINSTRMKNDFKEILRKDIKELIIIMEEIIENNNC